MASAAVVRKIGSVLVERVIEGGDALYSAWETAAPGSHGTTRSLDGTAFGRLDSKAYPGSLPDTPAAQIGAFVTWELAQRERAYTFIVRAFPEAAEGLRARGRIRLLGDPEVIRERLKRKKGTKAEKSMRDVAPTFAGLGGDPEKK